MILGLVRHKRIPFNIDLQVQSGQEVLHSGLYFGVYHFKKLLQADLKPCAWVTETRGPKEREEKPIRFWNEKYKARKDWARTSRPPRVIIRGETEVRVSSLAI